MRCPFPIPQRKTAERGRAEAEENEQLKAIYNRFLSENDQALKNEAGKDLTSRSLGRKPLPKIQFCRGRPDSIFYKESTSGAFRLRI